MEEGRELPAQHPDDQGFSVKKKIIHKVVVL